MSSNNNIDKTINVDSTTVPTSTTPPQVKNKMLSWIGPANRYLVAGAFAGIVSRTLTAPLERLKILNQIQPLMNSGTKYNNIIPGLRTIWIEEGIRGLFKGNLANVIKAAPQSAIRFSSYEFFKGILIKEDNSTSSSSTTVKLSSHKLWAGACAGVTSVVATYPLEVVKTQLSVQIHGDRYRGIIGTLATVVKENGVAGLFRGMSAGILNVAPFSALNFFAYETCKDVTGYMTGQPKIAVSWSVVHGAISGAFAMTVLYPLDVVKRRLMMQGYNNTPIVYRNFLHTIYRMVKDEGVSSLYLGIKPAYLKVIPTVSINFFTFEGILYLLDNNNK
ncbi:transmembrane protein [Cavenderia fasciculata]|uniref:Transmembrane protein n=1 Tax=Cavenderia fasciculata TaxID=261658 RepID=F4PPE3_CACFS|nr:uncharacterized protein DFA_04374 [Cavenderia fasciculata]EGG22256.1 transmembrane protein [Cavenderia fasciculata]|eukprot:XP_004360107.1 transmembrane protein [Cavenderia fasciculata]